MLKKFNKDLSEFFNTFEIIMENKAFAQRESKCSIFHNILKFMIFQRRHNALFRSIGLNCLKMVTICFCIYCVLMLSKFLFFFHFKIICKIR